MVDDWDEVRSLLDRVDSEELSPEGEHLYDEVDEYAAYARAYDAADQPDEADYMRELAVSAYHSLTTVMQLNQESEEYDF